MSTTTERIGDWMQTVTGRRFYPLDPRPEEIHIADIAGALSRVCRFGGHCREFYSVAQHSVLVSHVCDPKDALWGLLHDASEAYLGDLIRPLKHQPFAAEWRKIESDLQRMIEQRFGFDLWRPLVSVHVADQAALATEARDLMGHDCLARWGGGWESLRGIEPLAATIRPLPPREAEAEFLMRFAALNGGS